MNGVNLKIPDFCYTIHGKLELTATEWGRVEGQNFPSSKCALPTHFLGFLLPLSTMNLSYSCTPYRSERKERKRQRERTKEKLNRISKKESPYNTKLSSYCTHCLVTHTFWAPFFSQHFCCNLVSSGRNLLLQTAKYQVLTWLRGGKLNRKP